jgi:hypothetical protein
LRTAIFRPGSGKSGNLSRDDPLLIQWSLNPTAKLAAGSSIELAIVLGGKFHRMNKIPL